MGTQNGFYGDSLQHFPLQVLEAIQLLIPSFHRPQERVRSKSSPAGKYKTEWSLASEDCKPEASYWCAQAN